MKVTAIGSTLDDLQLCCFGTLSKFIKDGNEVKVIIANKTKTNMTEGLLKKQTESSKKIGIPEVYFTNGFDYSNLTQGNVQVLRSFLEEVTPSLAIIPFNNTFNPKLKILARCSLIACHGIENVLMYELDENPDFVPDTYLTISNEDLSKKFRLSAAYDNKRKQLQKKMRSLYKLHSRQAGIRISFEAFKSHRVLLVDNGF